MARHQASDDKTKRAVWAALGQTGEPPVGVLSVVFAERGQPRACACGCGTQTSGGTWAPGHDAKRKSTLHAAIRAGGKDKAAATAELVQRGWPLPTERKAKQAKPPVAKADKPQTATEATQEGEG